MSGNEHKRLEALDERVVEFVYGEMTDAQAAAFRTELSTRPDLQAQVDELTALQRHLDDVPVPEPPPDVVADIMAYAASRHRVVRTEPAPERRLTLADLFKWLLSPQAGMAMAAMLVVAVGVYMAQNARRPTEPGSATEIKERMRPTRAVAKEEATPKAAEEQPRSQTAKSEETPTQPAATAPGRQAAEAEEAAPETVKETAATGTPADDLAMPEERPKPQERVQEVQENVVQPPEEPLAKEATEEAGASSAADPEAQEPADEAVVRGGLKNEQVAPNLDSNVEETLSEQEKEEVAKNIGKVAVRSLVDGLDRRGSRDANDRGIATEEAVESVKAKKSVKARKKSDTKTSGAKKSPAFDQKRERKESAEKRPVDSSFKETNATPALDSKLDKGEMDGSGTTSGMAFQHGGAPAATQAEVSLEEAEDQEARAAETNGREWLGNTYNRAVGGEAPIAEPAREQVADDAPEAATGGSDQSPVAPSKPAMANTSVDEAWGVVPKSSIGQPTAVNPPVDMATETASLKANDLDFGDDLNDSGSAAPTVQAMREEPAKPAEPTMPPEPSEGQNAMEADEGAGEDLEGYFAAEASSKDKAQTEAKVAAKAEKKQSKKVALDDALMAQSAGEKVKEEANAAGPAKCDQYWVDLLKYKKKGQTTKALKLVKVFKSGICQGTRSFDDLAMIEAELYIASGKRSKARKVLEKLQKVPAMEEKALDMMEAIQEPGDAL